MMLEVILPIVLILVILSLLNCPVYLSILAAALYLQVFVIRMPLRNAFIGAFEGLAKVNLLAVPFFVLTGSIISSSTLGHRLMNFLMILLKRVRGGLPIACVFANAIFGAISGASSAAVATFGKITYEPLRDTYGEKTALGVITASASLSNIIPPSIGLIVYGVISETPITQLFMAGFLPGLLIVLLSCVFLLCTSRNFTSKNYTAVDSVAKKSESGELRIAFIRAVPVLLLPVVVLGSIYGGICTPTEAGAVSALYAFIFAAFIFKDIKFKSLLSLGKSSAKIVSQVFLIVSTSTVFAQAITITQLPRYVEGLFQNVDKWLFILILNILLLIVGCFFDTSPAITVFVPLLLSTAMKLGINPVHLGIIFIMNLGIGRFTPPFGMNIFVAQSVLKKNMKPIAMACVPYVIIYSIALFIVSYVPQIAMVLPSILL